MQATAPALIYHPDLDEETRERVALLASDPRHEQYVWLVTTVTPETTRVELACYSTLIEGWQHWGTLLHLLCLSGDTLRAEPVRIRGTEWRHPPGILALTLERQVSMPGVPRKRAVSSDEGAISALMPFSLAVGGRR